MVHSCLPHCRDHGRRGAGLALTSLLAASTALALTALTLTLGGLLVPSEPAAAATQTSLVCRFYDAANAVLAGADSTGFASVLAPTFVAHDPGGLPLDRTGFAAELGAVARAEPGLQLQIGPFVADGDWITVQVSVRSGAPVAAGGAIGDPTPAASTDWLQLGDDRVVGLWPGALWAALPQALPPLALGSWDAPMPLTLARIIYTPGASLGDLVAPGPQLFLIETGQLTVHLDGAAPWFAAAHPDFGWQTTDPARQDLTLGAGDALLVPPNVDQTQRNLETEPAAALSLASFPPSVRAVLAGTGITLVPADDQPAPPMAQAVSMYRADRLGQWTAWPIGIAVDVLASAFGATDGSPCVAAPIALTVTRLVLAPGAAMPAHAVGGIAVLAKGADWLVGHPMADGSAMPSPNYVPIMAEQGVGSVNGQLGGVRNLSQRPLDLALFVAAPEASAGCPAPDASPATPPDEPLGSGG